MTLHIQAFRWSVGRKSEVSVVSEGGGGTAAASLRGYWAKAPKRFCASPLLFEKALFKLTQVSWNKRQSATLSTGETHFKIPLVICVALENSRGERAKCF